MALEFKKTTAVARDLLGVEDAETLLEWLIKHPRGRVNLSACTHLHASNLQVLMAARPKISAWPKDRALADWLRAALTQ
ncbi:hypothetical protein [Imhoffiella purpurea]|uniref:Uncharacterized protein n=1 Tax=Imhoffiella purpurea TaxID=1249627 RepID=W9VU87_9GAMM|nr:hypothetical protein [Imhoffiella purpurea]EXJ13920.1 hypothetical protein D779_3120 [Imhoffiella purpurea]